MSEAEATVYAVLLTRPSMTIQEITNDTKLPRSTVVIAIQKLVRTGTIDEYAYGKRRNFAVSSIDTIDRYVIEDEKMIEARKAHFGQLLPDIRKLHFLAASQGMKVEMLKGKEDFKNLYNRTLQLKRGEEILRLNVDAEKFIFFRDFFSDYAKEKFKRKIKTRLIMPEGDKSRDVQKRDEQRFRETRYLPKKLYNPNASIMIWGSYVSLTAWDENLETIVVESRQLVDIFRSVFELLWQNAKK